MIPQFADLLTAKPIGQKLKISTMADEQSMETNEQPSANAPTTAGTNTATADEDDRKLFAGGLPQEAGEEDINEHFSQYGEIESVNLKTGTIAFYYEIILFFMLEFVSSIHPLSTL